MTWKFAAKNIKEHEADELARDSLVPRPFLSQVRWGEDTTQDEIITVSVRARVHTSVVGGTVATRSSEL